MAGRTYRLTHGECEAAPAGVGIAASGAGTAREPGRAPARTAAQEAGSPTSPIPGSVLRVAVRPGARVEPGSLLVVISAMKMEHEVRAERSGTVAGVRVKEGDRVEAGDVLLELTVDS
jgi:biotin carboxyl carrier protein